MRFLAACSWRWRWRSAAPAGAGARRPRQHVAAELVAERQGIAPGETIHVALRQQIQKGWHTYWRNSGDAGEPTADQLDPAGRLAGRRLHLGRAAAPAGRPADELRLRGRGAAADGADRAGRAPRPATRSTLKAAVSLLVCADVCVPEDDALTLDPAGHRRPGAARSEVGRADRRRRWPPRPSPAGARPPSSSRRAPGVALAITGAAAEGRRHGRRLFLSPTTPPSSTTPSRRRSSAGREGLTLTLAPGYAFQGGKAPREPGRRAGGRRQGL